MIGKENATKAEGQSACYSQKIKAKNSKESLLQNKKSE